MEKLLEDLMNAVMNGEEEKAEELAKKTIEAGMDPVKVITETLTKAMKAVGDKFEKMEIYLPEIMLAAEAMKRANGVLLAKVGTDKKITSKGKIVIGTAWGDIHDIGKTIVATMLTTNGYDVYDLGHDVPPNKFIEKSEEVKADIIAVSTLMTPSREYQRDIIKYLEDSGTRNKYLIMVGGGPVTEDWVREIKADGYGRMVVHAIEVANTLMQDKAVKKPIIKV
ncbi:MAG: cobalamin-dependent protein [Methanobacteriota archaeon]